ncbi:MAG: glycosyltransferase [Hyphomicrobiales bacterium]|nr:glycosyltransferase [Hyphomicrobiales bacterium]
MINVIGFSLYGRMAASHRYRLGQYVEPLAQQGIALEIQSLLDDDYLKTTFAGGAASRIGLAGAYARRVKAAVTAGRYDLAIVNCELLPLVPAAIEKSFLRIPYIYDFDDAFFLKYQHPRFKFARPFLANKFDSFVAGAAGVTAGNRMLLNYAQRWSANAHLLPTVVPTDRYVPRMRAPNDRFTVGWVGSPSTGVYLAMLRAPLQALAAEAPLRLISVGAKAAPIDNVEVVNLPWDEHGEIDTINSFDVGVMPLTDDEWSRGKCAFKMIQYMACGVPAVASAVGANIDVAEGGAALLARDESEWIRALRRLRDDAAFRQALGAAGRERIVASYSLESAVPKMAQAIHSVATRRLR